LFVTLPRDPRRRANVISGGIVIAVLAIVSVMWIVTAVSIRHANDAAMDRGRSDGRNLAAAFADEVSHILDGVAASMEVIAKRMQAEPDGPWDMYNWAKEIPVLAGATYQAALVGADGRIRSTALEPETKPIDLSDREHIRVPLDGLQGIFIGKPVIFRTTGKATIPVTRRVDAPDGSVLGVIVFGMAPAQLTALHKMIDIGREGAIALVGLDHVIRASFTVDHPDGLAAIGQSAAGSPRPSDVPAEDEGFYIHSSVIDGIERLFSYHRVAAYPLIVSVGLGLDEALAVPKLHARMLITITAFATVLLAALAGFLIREIQHRTVQAVELADERSKLQQANHRLRHTQEHLERAQRIAGIGSIDVDMSTGRLEWSAGACAIFGVTPEKVEPTIEYLLSFVHADDMAKVSEARARIYATGASAPQLEYRIIRPDGAVRVVQCENEVIREGAGEANRRIVTYRDVTELRAAEARQKELEAQLRHSQRLEALGTLAGGIAHDINNAMVPILALTQMMLENAPNGSAEREDLEAVAFGARRVKDLVNRVLSFSRKQEIQKAVIEPATLLRPTLQMLRAGLPPNIALIEKFDRVPTLLADAGQLQQVVVNLVTNAAQAIGQDEGRITVGLATEWQPDRPGDDAREFLRLTVADTGPGMDSETVERIFEPFFTTKAVGEGSGLGLSIVHGVVSGHAGRIEVQSTPGCGSVFTILLPVTQPATIEATAA
jgi:PAS domain S-box-containing protein